MKKKAVITGLILLVVGLIVGTVALFAIGFDFANMDTQKFTTNTYPVGETFQNIHISVKTGDVRLALSDTCRVDCTESKNYKFSVSVADDTLHIQTQDMRAWYDRIGIHTASPKATVYLTQSAYEALTVSGTTGDIQVEAGFTFQNAALEVTTGDISWSGSDAMNLSMKTTTGDMTLEDAATDILALKVSTGKIALRNATAFALSAVSTTGDITFDRFDARSMNIKTTTGDVTGTFLTPKQFDTQATTGDIQVSHDPKATDACKITVTTGDIKITTP